MRKAMWQNGQQIIGISKAMNIKILKWNYRQCVMLKIEWFYQKWGFPPQKRIFKFLAAKKRESSFLSA